MTINVRVMLRLCYRAHEPVEEARRGQRVKFGSVSVEDQLMLPTRRQQERRLSSRREHARTLFRIEATKQIQRVTGCG